MSYGELKASANSEDTTDQRGSGKPGEQVSHQAFTSHMVTKMVDRYFVADLPSYFAFVIKLRFPSPNSLSERVVWLSITKLCWHFKSKEQILDASEQVCHNPSHAARDTVCQQLTPPATGGGQEHQRASIHLDRLSINRQWLNMPDFKHYISFILTPKCKAVAEKIAHVPNDGLKVRQPDVFT